MDTLKRIELPEMMAKYIFILGNGKCLAVGSDILDSEKQAWMIFNPDTGSEIQDPFFPIARARKLEIERRNKLSLQKG